MKATYEEKDIVVDILTRSFNDNKSVNYIVKQDRKRVERIKALMDYSFEICYLFGNVYISPNKKACALILFPDKKKTTLKSILLDIKLILSSIGVSNIKKTLARESKVKETHPKELMTYIWFIGVDPDYQNKGAGTELLNHIIKESTDKQQPIYLETSTTKNFPWYQNLGFKIYQTEDLGHHLYFLKRELK